MENVLTDGGLMFMAFLAMEAVAWLAHKYLMHGFLWFLHRDHHRKESGGFFERNDFFFLIFAAPGILCLALGSFYHLAAVLWTGAGITLYGFCYFLVHDLFIHQRFKILRNSQHWYFNSYPACAQNAPQTFG